MWSVGCTGWVGGLGVWLWDVGCWLYWVGGWVVELCGRVAGGFFLSPQQWEKQTATGTHKSQEGRRTGDVMVVGGETET